MPTCSFCKRPYKEPRGLTIFTFDGRSVFFCSSKCRKNAKLNRDPKKVNWVRRGIAVVTSSDELHSLKHSKIEETSEEKE